MVREDRCIYREEGTKTFFHSVRLPGKKFPTKRKLAATTLTAARKEVETVNTRRREATLGVGLDPYTSLVTVGQLALAWQERGCPDRAGHARTGLALTTEIARLNTLLKYWSPRSAREILAYEDCPEYHAWRLKHRATAQFRLGRSVDAELMTLANLLQWAVMNPRKTGLNFNPLAKRPKFDNASLIRHCTKVMPATDEAFHHHATFLLASRRSEALGWQFLIEGLTGCRTSEILACRLDAQPKEPGYFDHTALDVIRKKEGIEPWSLMECAKGPDGKSHAPLRDCLNAFLNWHQQRFPECPWFIPGHKGTGKRRQVVDRCSLTHALEDSSAALNLPKITSHGQRAYFVACLRSLGHSDEETAARLGHRSTDMVEQTYGTVRAGFRGSWLLDFLPEDTAPAWALWTPKHMHPRLEPPTPAPATNAPAVPAVPVVAALHEKGDKKTISKEKRGGLNP